MEGKMVNGREEQIYIVAQAAKQRHPRLGATRRPREKRWLLLQFVIDKAELKKFPRTCATNLFPLIPTIDNPPRPSQLQEESKTAAMGKRKVGALEKVEADLYILSRISLLPNPPANSHQTKSSAQNPPRPQILRARLPNPIPPIPLAPRDLPAGAVLRSRRGRCVVTRPDRFHFARRGLLPCYYEGLRGGIDRPTEGTSRSSGIRAEGEDSGLVGAAEEEGCAWFVGVRIFSSVVAGLVGLANMDEQAASNAVPNSDIYVKQIPSSATVPEDHF
jgi:hypothetical protein